ncbi:MAG: hypothetical protein PUB35_02295 [Campylobacteraceae bacterium]|nr:hypothetical protein [Campylobacteraceae bacterium]
MLKDFCFLNNDEILAVFYARSQPEIYSFLGDFSGRKNELKAFKKIRILGIIVKKWGWKCYNSPLNSLFKGYKKI